MKSDDAGGTRKPGATETTATPGPDNAGGTAAVVPPDAASGNTPCAADPGSIDTGASPDPQGFPETAELLLETMPRVMGYVGCELRRNSPVNNPVHFRLLRTLRGSPHSMHELADLQSVRMPTMSRTVSSLEKRGWVARVRSDQDRRTVRVEITDAGRDALEEVERIATARALSLLDAMDQDVRNCLAVGLQALSRVVSSEIGYSIPEENE